MADELRLQVYLAKCGLGSRRKCEEFIEEGRVMVNDQLVFKLGAKVGEGDRVVFDGREVFPTKKNYYIVLNKPPKFLCTNADPEGRPIALDLLKGHYPVRLFSVGRLDFLSSGLIIFTNDGEFAKKLSHPRYQVEKEYLVETKKPIEDGFLEACKHGIWVEGEKYKIKSWRRKTERIVYITLEEGKNRELRNIFGSKANYPKRIHRIRIGKLQLGKLLSGEFRDLTQHEIKSLVEGQNPSKQSYEMKRQPKKNTNTKRDDKSSGRPGSKTAGKPGRPSGKPGAKFGGKPGFKSGEKAKTPRYKRTK